MTILGLADSFKSSGTNPPGPTVALFDGLFIGKYKIIFLLKDERFSTKTHTTSREDVTVGFQL